MVDASSNSPAGIAAFSSHKSMDRLSTWKAGVFGAGASGLLALGVFGALTGGFSGLVATAKRAHRRELAASRGEAGLIGASPGDE